MSRILLTAPLLLASSAWAGPEEDARVANKRGDYATALKITKPMAAKGEASAQAQLGFMYYEGQGVGKDYAESVKWYRLAAAQGFVGGHYNLGVMYASGQGVAVNFVLAHLFFNLAAAKGVAEAVKERDTVTLRLDARQLADAQHLAREFINTREAGRIDFMKAAEQKYTVQERQDRRESEARVAAEMRRYDEKVAAEKLAEDKREDARDTANFWRGVLRGVAPQQPPPSQPPMTCTTTNHDGRITTTCN